MKILVINTGSSSIKYELFNMEDRQVLASGIAEKIGEDKSKLTHKVFYVSGKSSNKIENETIADHNAGLRRIVDLLMDPENGAIKNKSEIKAIGHRVVHGGEGFQSSTIINQKVIAALEENIPLAPLHNPPNLTGIEVATSIFPEAIQVGVFDTAFHQTLPPRAFIYALPYKLYENHKIRRYGFHGSSHSYVAEIGAEYLGKPLKDLNLITIHAGNGASMAAIQKGKSIDTSMGLTPLAGLTMGTRSGDIDPAIIFFLADQSGIPLKEIKALLNKESGLKGLCGTNDMREVIVKRDAGDKKAKIALDIYSYNIKKYIGAYYAALGNVDSIIFTAGIGENSPIVREQSCEGLIKLGIKIDPAKNNSQDNSIREISSTDSEVRILVIPTNEELKIAMETKKVIETSGL